MNKAVLVGRLTKDPEIRYTQDGKAVAQYTLAVDRRFKREGKQEADFIRCVCFGKAAEFCQQYFVKGMRIALSGHIQTGNYKDKDGKTVYTTDVIVEEQEFAQSKSENTGAAQENQSASQEWQSAEEVKLPW